MSISRGTQYGIIPISETLEDHLSEHHGVYHTFTVAVMGSGRKTQTIKGLLYHLSDIGKVEELEHRIYKQLIQHQKFPKKGYTDHYQEKQELRMNLDELVRHWKREFRGPYQQGDRTTSWDKVARPIQDLLDQGVKGPI